MGGAYGADYPAEGATKILPDSTKTSLADVVFTCGDGNRVTFAALADQFVITARHVTIQGGCFYFNRLWIGDGANGVSTDDVTVNGVHMFMFDISGGTNETIENSTIGPDVSCYAPSSGSPAACQNRSDTNEAYFYAGNRPNTQYSEPKVHSNSPSSAQSQPSNVSILNNSFQRIQTRDSSNLHTGCLWVGYSGTGATLLRGNSFSECAIYDVHIDTPLTPNLTFTGNAFGHSVEPVQTGSNFTTETTTSQTEIQLKCQINQTVSGYTITSNTFEHGWDLDFGGCSGASYQRTTITNNVGGSIQNPRQPFSAP